MTDKMNFATTQEAYLTGKRESNEHYRDILAMYKVQTIALEAKHAEEIEICRIEAKLELIEDLIHLEALKTSPDSLFSVAKALAIASPAISSTNRHPLVYCADSTSICSLRRLSADSNLNELNMGHDYSYSQPSESEEYGGYTVDSGYSET
ncbi:hypothetical protein Bca52824_023572 [Brassica carinata]|uniref:Uncharacterized protein n=1 Tax=Brassica carinata TaxID=52824 RepID=A0A8X7VJB4_BRACI|nr:hypothetical protein Bca52824_023572 [Brassica carinata]